MVQEVVPREAELQFLVLGGSPGEILEQRQVGIKEARAGQGWEDVAALLARCGKTLEAVPVDVLARPKFFLGSQITFGMSRTSGVPSTFWLLA